MLDLITNFLDYVYGKENSWLTPKAPIPIPCVKKVSRTLVTGQPHLLITQFEPLGSERCYRLKKIINLKYHQYPHLYKVTDKPQTLTSNLEKHV